MTITYLGCHAMNIYKDTKCDKWAEMLHRWGNIYDLKLCQVSLFSPSKIIVKLELFYIFLSHLFIHILDLSVKF